MLFCGSEPRRGTPRARASATTMASQITKRLVNASTGKGRVALMFVSTRRFLDAADARRFLTCRPGDVDLAICCKAPAARPASVPRLRLLLHAPARRRSS